MTSPDVERRANPTQPALLAAYRRSGLTREQVAARALVPKRTVDRVLAGEHVVTHSLIAVAGVFGYALSLTDALASNK